ncbi:MAG: vitamin K epoxide reductase family protein [Patescibacteria group bacterium]|nr:vitamin K epoxide reductase family protein [Patescibacteria group bacterium]
MQEKPSLSPYILIALSFIGIADTLYLSMLAYTGASAACNLLHGCDIVLHSAYSKFFGMPLGYLGLVYYLYMLALGLLIAIEPKSKVLRIAALIYTGIGLLLSIGFETLQATVIHALCEYCALSALTTLLLFVVALWYWKKSNSVLA